MYNETIKSILERRSIRRYEDRQIKEEDLDLILKAGTYAASGRGAQAPIIISIQSPEVIRELSKINASIFNRETDPFFGAPTVIMVLTDKSRNTGVEDASLVLGNMMLAAHSLGLGTCWVHRAKEELDFPFVQGMLKALGIDHTKYRGVGHITLGYPAVTGLKAAPRKDNYIYKIK
ncbi:MAG: nitroreductase family protein [Acholeplasmataceae bacterium]|jgi:nitroreductase